MDQAVITTMTLTAVIVAAITYQFTKRSYKRAITIEVERDFLERRNALIDETKAQSRQDDGHMAILHNEYLKGKIDGANEELAKFSVTFQPYTITREEYLGIKKRVEVGYEMQMFYGQFAIGEPAKRVLNEDVKFDQAVIDKLMNNEVIKLINNVSQTMLTKGMKTKTLPPTRKKPASKQ